MLFGWDGLAMGMMDSVKQYKNICLYMQVSCLVIRSMYASIERYYLINHTTALHIATAATIISPSITRSRW